MNWRHIFFLAMAVFALTQPVYLQVAGQTVSRVATELQFLQRAVLQRDVVAIQEFLGKFGDINQADTDGLTLLHYAALEGLLPAAELLQHLGADTSLTDKSGLLPFDYAEFGGHLEIQQLLLGIEPAAVDWFTAVTMNAQRALDRWLGDSELDINARNAEGKTALHLSAEQGSFYPTKRLIAAGADIFAKDKDGNIPLDLALNEEHALVISVLLAAADINAKEEKGWTALNWAILSGNKSQVRELLAKGAKIGEGCQNAIEVCLLMQDMEMFEIVLDAGAGTRQGVSKASGIDAASSRGDTALMGVSRRGDASIVTTLLAHGASPNVADMRRGYTPLRLAAENNHLSIVKQLIAHGAALDTVDSLGDTALIRAALHGHTEAVQILINAGADLNIKGAGGMTALMWAIYWNEKETAKALLQAGADIRILNSASTSALSWAVQRSDLEMVRMVLSHLDTASHTGKGDVLRSLVQAVRRNATELQEILLAHLDDADETAVEHQQQAMHNARSLAKGMLLAAQDGVDYQTRIAVAEEHADAPLQWLIANNKLAMLEKILQEPLFLNLNAVAANGFTPIMQALWNESPALETLLSQGADPNCTTVDCIPPIVSAATFGNKEAVKILLAWRADPDATDAKGFSALMRAVAGGYFELAELLLLEGANPHLINEEGYDALALAEKNEQQEIVKILRAAKEDEE